MISAFAAAWCEQAGGILGNSSELSLLALRQVAGEQMAGALAVAMTWSSAFAAPCTGVLPGVLIALFKSEEADEIDRLVNRPTDGSLKPGARALVNTVLSATSARLAAEGSAAISFGDASYIDLSSDESRLGAIVGQSAHVGTFALTIGEETSQSLLLYAPQGALQSNTNASANVHTPAPPPAPPSMQTQTSTAQPPAQPQAPTRRGQPRAEAPKNIERLLGVELDVIVRFGVTSVPLRDVVRMGVGTIIELDRTVEEPVELLVNGRLLGRGEVVLVDGYYGVRITEIGAPSDRPLSLT